jgi:hypothetical protein
MAGHARYKLSQNLSSANIITIITIIIIIVIWIPPPNAQPFASRHLSLPKNPSPVCHLCAGTDARIGSEGSLKSIHTTSRSTIMQLDREMCCACRSGATDTSAGEERNLTQAGSTSTSKQLL